MLSVSILCTDPDHPVNPWLSGWAEKNSLAARVSVHRDRRELVGGDFLFLVSCQQIIAKQTRDLFRHTLVLHASDLPKGRGMSPHVWQILQGADEIVMSLLNAEDALDSGDIWQQQRVQFDGTELHDEINGKLFAAELWLMDWALANCDRAQPRRQQGASTFYRRRTPADSAIDPARPLLDSFNLLRVADPERYPAYFEHRGKRYRLRIERA
jgi:methionyl-tRNA formyltransferase